MSDLLQDARDAILKVIAKHASLYDATQIHHLGEAYQALETHSKESKTAGYKSVQGNAN